MIRFAANLSMMFTEWPFLDRFQAAAEAGFEAVEYLFPYDFPPETIEARLKEFRLVQALFNLPPGDWAAGERGIAALPGRFGEFRDGLETALEYAEATGVKRLHLMSGIADRRDPEALAAYEKALRFAADRLAGRGMTLLIEPINNRSMPGYLLDDFDFAENLVRNLGITTLKLQFDIFHRQIMRGDVTESLRRLVPLIGHVQIAGVPHRHEPDGGELNLPYILETLEASGYDGFIGCEYVPAGRTLDGLGWIRSYWSDAR